MRGRRPESEAPRTDSRWLITYADLCILLLSFFVLLVSMSSIDKNRQKKAMGSVEGSFGFQSSSSQTPLEGKSPSGKAVKEAPLSPEEVEFRELRKLGEAYKLDPSQMRMEKRGTVISLDWESLFRQGSLEISPAMGDYLSRLAPRLAQGDRRIDLEGHVEVPQGSTATNPPERSWLLSLARAQAVSAFLQARGVGAARLSAHGFAHHPPDHEGGSVSDGNEKNQRLDIVILAAKKSAAGNALSSPGARKGYFNYKNFFFDRFPEQERHEN